MVKEIKRFRVICDRCRKAVEVGEVEEAGYIKINPPGKEERHICPECNNKFEYLFDSFMESRDNIRLISEKNLSNMIKESHSEGFLNAFKSMEDFGVKVTMASNTLVGMSIAINNSFTIDLSGDDADCVINLDRMVGK